MPIDRETTLARLRALISGEMRQDEVYHWALSKAVSAEFKDLALADPLLYETIASLLDMSHEDAEFVPSREDFEYYIRCFEGREEFRSLREKRKRAPAPSQRKFFQDFDLTARLYVILFAICSIVIHLISIVNPNFLRIEPGAPSLVDSFFASLPHLVYAAALLLPLRLTGRGNAFFFFFMLFSLGAFYYTYLSIDLILKLSLPILIVLVVLPFSGVPACLALYLLIKERKKYFSAEDMTAV